MTRPAQHVPVPVTLPSDARTRRLKRIVGPAALAHLVELWCWIGSHDPGMSLASLSEADVEDAAGWDGTPGVFAAALREAGWVGPDGEWSESPFAWLLQARESDRQRKSKPSARPTPPETRRFPPETVLIPSAPAGKVADPAGTPSLSTGNVPLSTGPKTVVVGVEVGEQDNSDEDDIPPPPEGGGAPLEHWSPSRLSAVPASAPSGSARVWSACLALLGPEMVLTRERQATLERWLEAYTVEQLVRTVEGYAGSSWHRGANEQGRRFLSFELVFRDVQHVEGGWDLRASKSWRDPRTPPPTPPSSRSPVEDEPRPSLDEIRANPENVPAFLRERGSGDLFGHRSEPTPEPRAPSQRSTTGFTHAMARAPSVLTHLISRGSGEQRATGTDDAGFSDADRARLTPEAPHAV